MGDFLELGSDAAPYPGSRGKAVFQVRTLSFQTLKLFPELIVLGIGDGGLV